jgi:hypothetical protein
MANLYALKLIGVAGIFSYGVAKLLAKAEIIAYRRYKLVGIPLDAMPKMPKGFETRLLTPQQLANEQIDVGEETQAARFAAGLKCLGTYNAKGVLVATSWVTDQDYEEDEAFLRYQLPENCCWDTGLWVAPEFRGGRAFAAAWAGLAGWMRERGLRWSLSRITDYNLASLQSHSRLKAIPLGSCIILKAGTVQFATSAKPRLASTRATTPPVLELDVERA